MAYSLFDAHASFFSGDPPAHLIPQDEKMKTAIRPFSAICLSLLYSALAVSNANAQVQLSNIGVDGLTGTSLASFPWPGQSFGVAGGDFNLIQIDAWMDASTAEGFYGSLYLADVGGAPTGARLITLTQSNTSTELNVIEFIPDASFTLINSINYVFAIEQTVGGAATNLWAVITGTTTLNTGPNGWSVGNASRSTDFGASWSALGPGDLPAGQRQALSVYASAVPEPSAFTFLAGMGAIVFAGLRRNRRRS